ncbi:putative F-box domain-containing protein, partial [Tanacetum coccineum]
MRNSTSRDGGKPDRSFQNTIGKLRKTGIPSSFIVANPWTREERMLQKLPVSPERSCWGFGYDALTDDYKVVFGAAESLEKTAFQVFSLKSNVWKHDGHVNYRFLGDVQIGTLCNGALHWIGYLVTKRFIISFDLSKE